MVAVGTGIGFPAVPYELTDLSSIQRTYYDIDPMYLSLLNEIPDDIFVLSTEIVNLYRNRVNGTVSSNTVFTLADHINFALERQRKNIQFDTPLQYDVQHLYETEYQIGLEAVKLIQKEIGERLPKNEAANIALHLINAGSVATVAVQSTNEQVIHDVVDIIASYFKIYIDKDSVAFSRFVSHFQYLLKREQAGKQFSSENNRLFKSVSKEYPESYHAVQKIADYLKEELAIDLSEEELLYLILHVNKLCVREECHRK